MNSGDRCSVCGSIYVYMHAWGGCDVHPDLRCCCPEERPDVPYCKPCLYQHAHERGYFERFEGLMEKMKADERERVARIEEKAKLNQPGPPVKRKYKKRGEEEDPGNTLFSDSKQETKAD